jgi:hypothetical protein
LVVFLSSFEGAGFGAIAPVGEAIGGTLAHQDDVSGHGVGGEAEDRLAWDNGGDDAFEA